MQSLTSKYILSSLPVLVFSLIAMSCTDRKTDMKNINKTWKAYTQALYTANGKEATKCIDSATINYYAASLFDIKTDDSITIEHLPFDRKILVLSTRHLASKESILKMDGQALFTHLVATGMQGPIDSNHFIFSILSVKSNTAKTQLSDSTGKPLIPLEFHREYGQWKVNLISFRHLITDETWKEVISRSGLTERELIYTMLEQMNGKEPQNRIWHPLNTY